MQCIAHGLWCVWINSDVHYRCVFIEAQYSLQPHASVIVSWNMSGGQKKLFQHAVIKPTWEASGVSVNISSLACEGERLCYDTTDPPDEIRASAVSAVTPVSEVNIWSYWRQYWSYGSLLYWYSLANLKQVYQSPHETHCTGVISSIPQANGTFVWMIPSGNAMVTWIFFIFVIMCTVHETRSVIKSALGKIWPSSGRGVKLTDFYCKDKVKKKKTHTSP